MIGYPTTAFPQAFDNAPALIEIVPEITRVKPLHFLLGVAEQLPDLRIVKEQPAILVDHVEPGGTTVENFPKLTLVLGTLRFALPQCRNVINPGNALAASEANVTAAIGSLRIGNKDVDMRAKLGEPDCLRVEDLIGILVQRFNDAGSLIKVVPEFSGIEELQLFFGVTKQFANTRVVEEQSAVFVHHVQPGRTVFENFPELALVLCDVAAGRTIDRA